MTSAASRVSVVMTEEEAQGTKRSLEETTVAKSTLVGKVMRKERYHPAPRIPVDEWRWKQPTDVCVHIFCSHNVQFII